MPFMKKPGEEKSKGAEEGTFICGLKESLESFK